MVKVAIAGANSGLALEVIDALVRDQTHEVIALVRKDPSGFPQQANVTWVRTDYQDKAELVKLFRGVSAVLNFIVVNNDPDSAVSKRLIDAAVEAGVHRFAPSEWAMGQKLRDVIDVVPWYQGKLDIQAYLRDINKDKKVIEYSFFHPGMFMEYISTPRQTTKHVPPMPTLWQLGSGRAVVVRGHEHDSITVTSVDDIANIVRLAIEYEGVWPEIGGIQGQQLSVTQFKSIVEAEGALPTGKTEFTIDFAEEEDVKKGVLNVYMPPLSHPSIPEDQRKAWHAPGWSGMLYAMAHGAWTATDEWNKLLPDYKFKTIQEFVKVAI
ncbi:hypothetical protein F503_02306 [Ophiostoma piceae UAMH 11346]|uniref:NmrA-like domain-containing protein n=1 Tax=Ophiostoma piceae (strain UAMH 11346) TaxID=1262450 RepID=S3BYD9_OPHP1|nr:hypothetical protein F503_02306 [Ophiostoma piceae UAMH 11346]